MTGKTLPWLSTVSDPRTLAQPQGLEVLTATGPPRRMGLSIRT